MHHVLQNHQFLLDICKPSTWITQRYKGVWNGLTSVLPFSIHSELTVFLFSANMLLSLACLWTLPHNVSSEQFWWIISSCTRLTAGHTHVGASSGSGRVFPYWCRTDTCSPDPLTWPESVLLTLNCACKNALI